MIWENVKNLLGGLYIPQITIMDILEIAIIVYILYKFIKSVQNTRTMLLIKAICILFIVYFIAEICSFNVITTIFQGLAVIVVIASIIIFQPELRKALEKIGSTEYKSIKSLLKRKKKNQELLRFSDETINGICNAAFALSTTKTGALIVLEKDTPLTEYIDTGIPLNADVSSALLINIFEKNTPLHDGAIIVSGNKIVSGTCYLPLTDSQQISKKLGTRHRAAIGATENSDCFVVVVSEETGGVSFIDGGVITKCKTKEMLCEKLQEKQVKETIVNTKIKITDNWVLKLFAVFAGLSMWLIMMNSLDPVVTVKIEDVPITVINEHILNSNGKTYEITSSDTVDITITDVRSVIENIRTSDITVTADMSKLSYVFSVPLSVNVNNNTTKAAFIDENTMTVSVDDIIAKEFALTFKKVGEASHNYYVSKITSPTEGIVITGAERLINTIDRVEFTVDVTGANQNFSKQVSPVVYDKNGAIVDLALFELSKDSIIVNAELLNTKIIPVNITLAKIAEDSLYELSIEKYEPSQIKIAANDDLLNELENVDIEIKTDIKPSEIINSSFTKEINIQDYLPENVYCAEKNEKINIVINYKPFETKVITFSTNDVLIQNTNSRLKTSLKSSILQLEVVGLQENIENLTITDFAPYIDVKGLQIGVYNIPIQYKNIENVKIKNTLNVELVIEK